MIAKDPYDIENYPIEPLRTIALQAIRLAEDCVCSPEMFFDPLPGDAILLATCSELVKNTKGSSPFVGYVIALFHDSLLSN